MKKFIALAVLLFLGLPSLALAEGTANPAQSWNNHYNLYFILMAVIFFIVTIPLVVFSFRYRRKNKEDVGADVHGNLPLEVLWTVVPLIIVIFLGVQTWAVYKEYRAVPKNSYEVNIEGFMWGWNITYPEGIKTANELVVPVGQPVKVSLTSKDVLHAFFIPDFRVQEEAIPGRTTYFWFLPEKVGEYSAFCTEFCGDNHSLMVAKIKVMEKADFEAWIASQKSAEASMTPEQKGKKLVQDLGCRGCHSLNGEKSSAPTFKGIYNRETVLEDGSVVKADAEYIERAIIKPKEAIVKGYSGTMPASNLSEDDAYAIADYLKTLK